MHNYYFMQEHKLLSQVSEQQLESYHAQFNIKLWKHHNNIKAIDTRLKRTLADLSLKTMKENTKKKQKKRIKNCNTNILESTIKFAIILILLLSYCKDYFILFIRLCYHYFHTLSL